MVSYPVRMLCPFIGKPFESCYCASTSSLYTEATIYYCGGNFKKCEIYEKHIGSKETITENVPVSGPRRAARLDSRAY